MPAADCQAVKHTSAYKDTAPGFDKTAYRYHCNHHSKKALQTVPLSPYPIAAISIHGAKEIMPAAIDTAAKTTHSISRRLGGAWGREIFENELYENYRRMPS